MESKGIVEGEGREGREYTYDEVLPHIKEYGRYQIIMQVTIHITF